MELTNLPRFLNRIKRFSKSYRISLTYFLAFLLLLTDLSPVFAATFTPGMAKRDGPGPFTGGVIYQGKWSTINAADRLEFSRGTQISSSFYSVIDADQGSVVLWITPEWNGNDGKIHDILDSTGGCTTPCLRTVGNGELRFYHNYSNYVAVDISSWVAGNTYSVVLRWDGKNTLDGANYASISINDVHTFGETVAGVYGAPGNLRIGSPGTGQYAADSIIEGLTIYRRPLFDGTYGIDVGNGDEINQIYNSGTGKDPTLITGSWDVVFALPTNSSTGALATGTGNAWTHPHASNLLYTSTTNTGGFMMNGTYASDSWSIEGLNPLITVEALATSEKIYAGGYKTTSDGLLANEGIYYDKTVVAGNDWVIRALAHSDGTSIPKVILYDQTNGAEIGSLTGTSTSTRTDPDVFIFTGEAPSGMTTLRVKLVNTQASGTTYWHQVEVLSNLIDKPSMESGSGDPWVPTGWTNNGLDAGDSSQSTTTYNSGSSATYFTASVSGGSFEGMDSNSFSITSGNFYSRGGWVSVVSGTVSIINTFQRSAFQYLSSLNSNQDVSAGTSQRFAVLRAAGSSEYIQFRRNASYTIYVDDVYQFGLTSVSLTVTPASQANSTENTDEIRVDGRDTYIASSSEAADVGTAAGYISFNWRPRHAAADAVKWAETTSDDAYIVSFAGDSDDYINVYWDSANTIRMSYSMAGSTGTTTWDATGTIVANTEYDVVLSYTGDSTMTLSVDGTTRITLSSIPATFGTAPNTVYFGSDTTGANQVDATFSDFIFDGTAPSISLTPISPDPTSDNTSTLSGTATEAIGTVTSVEFQVDSTVGSWSACLADDAVFDEASETFTCTTSSLSDGAHTIYVRATDTNGNTTGSGSESSDAFTVDVTPPTTPGTPSTTSPTADTTPIWTWTASTDATSGLAATPYTVDWSQSSSFASGVSSSTSTTNSFTHSTPLSDGTWYFRVKATDVATNESSYSSNGSVQINTGAPTGTITINSGDSYTNNLAVTLNLSASSGFFSSTDDIDMKISNLSDLSDASYEAFTATKSWTLLSGDGTKTAYVQFKDTTNNESAIFSDTIVFDATKPEDIDLKDPDSKSYTSSVRPDFKWKETTDATSDLNKYKVEIDNGDSGDFTIDDIPTTNSSDYETSKFNSEYEDSNISVHTKSSVTWGNNNNDGKLKEGSRKWNVIAVDNAGNERNANRTLFVDKTSPFISVTQVNTQQFTSSAFSTTDMTPTIYGKVIDELAGIGTKVASGPKEVEIQIEKAQGLGYITISLTTLSLGSPRYTCTNLEVPDDNKEQDCDKYQSFEFTPKESLEFGAYRLTLTGKDLVDNVSDQTSFTLYVVGLDEILTPKEIEQFEEETKDLTPEELEKVIEEKEVTKAEEPSAIDNGKNALSNIFNSIKDWFSRTSSAISSSLAYTGRSIYDSIKATSNATLASLKEALANAFFTLGEKTENLSNNFSSVVVKFGYLFATEPTQIYDVEVLVLSPTSAKITWQTNHPATGKVNYGLDETYPFDLQTDKRTTYHEFTLTNLEPNTEYSFEVMSQNKNYVYDANRKFVTPN